MEIYDTVRQLSKEIRESEEYEKYKKFKDLVKEAPELKERLDNFEKARLILKEMVELQVLEMVEKNYVTDQLVLDITYDVETYCVLLTFLHILFLLSKNL